MTRFLVSDENPGGFRLEDILTVIRADVLKRCTKIALDDRPEAQHVIANNARVLVHLTEAIELARDSAHAGPGVRPLQGGRRRPPADRRRLSAKTPCAAPRALQYQRLPRPGRLGRPKDAGVAQG